VGTDWRRHLPRFAPVTLAGRLALTYAMVVIVVVAVLGQYLSSTARDFYLSGLQTDLQHETTLINEIMTRELAAGAGGGDLDTLAKSLGDQIDARITFVAPDGTVLGDTSASPDQMENHRTRPEIVAALRGEVGVGLRLSDTLGVEHLYLATRAPGVDNVVRIGVPTSVIDAAVAPIETGLRIGALVTAVIVAVVGVAVAQRIAEPLDRLRQQANAVASGRLEVQVEPAATYELGEVGRAFNLMTQQVRTSLTEAEEARVRLESTLASLTDGVVVTDGRGNVVQMNAAAKRMLGVGIPFTGVPFVQISRDHELVQLLNNALERNSVESGTIDYGRTRRMLEATAQRMNSPREQLAIVVVRDVTELRKLEGVRREFVANVSHELRTPLASIRALVETLETGAIDEPAIAADFLGRIVHEVDRLANLVDELLDLARLESGRVTLRLEPLRPDDVLSVALERLRSQVARAGLSLVSEIPADLPAMSADRARIEQVMLNLVHNAIKFTPSGGRITVSARADRASIVVTVADTGVGVAEEEMPRLFERFYKADRARSSNGTGLGLAIAKHIVQVHGGVIWAESKPGEGARFFFSVPRADALIATSTTTTTLPVGATTGVGQRI
jgi:two-component system phosphate regulon sensor histidine kinase PhoR